MSARLGIALVMLSCVVYLRNTDAVSANRVVVNKSARTMLLRSGDQGRKTYKVALRGPGGTKVRHLGPKHSRSSVESLEKSKPAQ